MAFKYKKYSGIPKISSAVVLIAFFLPIFIVKCNDTPIDELSGVELVIGSEVKQGSDILSDDPADHPDEEYSPPRVFAILCLFAALLSTALAFFKNESKLVLALAVSGIGLLSLLGLYFEVNSDTGPKNSGFITIHVALGYFLVMFGFLGQLIYYGLMAKVLRDRENHSKTVDDLRR